MMLSTIKKSGAGALFRNASGALLIVKPTYKDGWLFVGGNLESNETPSEACARETREELGLEKHFTRLLCVDYGKRDDETVTYIFDGGILTDDEIARIVLPESELSAYRFVSPDEALTLLRTKGARRLPFCLAALSEGKTFYLENGASLECARVVPR